MIYQVLNCIYPITTHIIHTVFAKFGKVDRIVIFKRLSIIVMVEFHEEAAANRAKEELHGSYLYTGSCALKIEYGTKERLDVRENSDTHWDYTKAGPVDVGTAKKLLKVLKT